MIRLFRACVLMPQSLLFGRVDPCALAKVIAQEPPGFGVRRIAPDHGRQMGTLLSDHALVSTPGSQLQVALNRISGPVSFPVVERKRFRTRALSSILANSLSEIPTDPLANLTADSPCARIMRVEMEGLAQLGVALCVKTSCLAPEGKSHVGFGITPCSSRRGSVGRQIVFTAQASAGRAE